MIKSMLQMAEAEHQAAAADANTRSGGLHEQPIVEEEEGEGDATANSGASNSVPATLTEKEKDDAV